MSRILRRPMFRGGPVDSYGTGIASGLADGGRVRLFNGGDLKTGSQIQNAAEDKWKNYYMMDSGVAETFPGESDIYKSGVVDQELLPGTGETGTNWLKWLADQGPEGAQDLYDTILEEQDQTNKKKEEAAIRAEGFLPAPGPEKGVRPIKKVEGLSDTSILNTNITADDAELSLEEIKEALGAKKAKVQDWSDAALNFFAQTQKEGATLGSALGATAEKVASKPSRTEVINEKAATFMLKDKYQTKRDKAKVELMKSQIDYKLSEGRKISLSEGILASTKGGQTTDKKLAIGIQSSTSPVTGDKYKFVGVTDASGLKAALAGGQLKAGDTVIVKQKITKEDGTEKTIKKIIEIDLDGNPQEVFNI